MRLLIVFQKLAVWFSIAYPCFLYAQPYLSTDSLPACYEVEARVRNGIKEYESALFTPSTTTPMEPGGTRWQLNPAGKPAWNTHGHTYGTFYAFQLSYTAASGTTSWQLDFSGDGDFDDANERVTNIAPTLAGKGFQYVNVRGQGNATGKTLFLRNLKLNQIHFGNWSSNSNTPFEILFEDASGMFNDITISGEFAFSGNGSTERPRLWLRLGESNIAPECVLTQPHAGAQFAFVDSILLVAAATDLGIIRRMQFYADDVLIGEDETKPFTCVWQQPPSGSHLLYAVATDHHEAQGRSPEVPITIKGPPQIRMVSPRINELLYDPDSLMIEAIILDGDDAFNHVTFFINQTSIGVDASGLVFKTLLLNPAIGNYTVKAEAVDMAGNILVSPEIQFTIRCIREDLDNNGVVNTFDFLEMLSQFGNFCTSCPADFNEDGQVNTNDFLRMLIRLGHSCN